MEVRIVRMAGDKRLDQVAGRPIRFFGLDGLSQRLADVAQSKVGPATFQFQADVITSCLDERLVVFGRLFEKPLAGLLYAGEVLQRLTGAGQPGVDGIAGFAKTKQSLIPRTALLLGQYQIFFGQVTGSLPGIVDQDRSHDRDDRHQQQGSRPSLGPGSMTPRPTPNTRPERLRISGNRFVGQPVFNVLGQGGRRGITILRFHRHGLQANRLQGPGNRRINLTRPRKISPTHLLQYIDDTAGGKRISVGQQGLKRRSQAVDVGGRPHNVQTPFGLLGTHVSGRTDHATHLRGAGTAPGYRVKSCLAISRLLRAIHRLGHSPVHYQGLTKLAQHDVCRFQISMHNATAVGIPYSVTNVDETGQQLTELQCPFTRQASGGVGFVICLDGRLEALSADEPHGIERAPVGSRAESVDRNNARML